MSLDSKVQSDLKEFGWDDLPWVSGKDILHDFSAFFEHPNGAVFFVPFSTGDGSAAVSTGVIVDGKWKVKEWHDYDSEKAETIIRRARASLTKEPEAVEDSPRLSESQWERLNELMNLAFSTEKTLERVLEVDSTLHPMTVDRLSVVRSALNELWSLAYKIGEESR